MSHNASGIAPHVLSFSPATFISAGVQDIVITTARGSTSCRLDIPAALGTVISGPTLSNASSGQIDLTYSCNILAPPGTPATRVCTLSNGGHVNTGVAISILHQDWTPAVFVSGGGGFWDASNASTVILAGDPTYPEKVSEWRVTAGTHQPLTASVSSEQPSYRSNQINGEAAVVFEPWYAGGSTIPGGGMWARMYPTASDWGASGDHTMAVLVQYPGESAATSGNIYYIADGWVLNYKVADASRKQLQYFTGGSAVNKPHHTLDDNTVRQYIVEVVDSATPGADTMTVSDGTIVAGGSGITGTMAGGSTPQISGYQIQGGASPQADQLIAQVLWVPRLLTSPEKTQLLNYWTNKYGV